MKTIGICIWKRSVFGGEIFNTFEQACFRNAFRFKKQQQKKQNKKKKKKKKKKQTSKAIKIQTSSYTELPDGF